MKKLFALMLALMMMLFSISALAETKTVTIKATVDKDMLSQYGSLFGLRDRDATTVNAAVALVNALTIKIIAAENDGELAIDLRDGSHLVSIAGGINDNGAVIGSDLIPSYLMTISQEYIEQMMQQFMQQMPGDLQNMDVEALMNKLYGYVGKFIASMGQAITPGTAEAVTFNVEGYTFDTKTPYNVDVKAIAEAEKTLVSDLMRDETIAQALSSFGQGFNPEEVIQQNAQAMSEEHLPDVTVDVYTNSSNAGIFYAESLATYKGQEKASFRFTMLNKDEGNGKMTFYILDQGIEIGLAYSPDSFLFDVTGNGAYMGLTVAGNGGVLEFYFMDQTRALGKVEIAVENGGAVSVDLNTANKTVISMEDIQNNKVDQTVQQGLMNEIQSNGMGMIMKLMSAVPEASSLIQSVMYTTPVY